MSTKPGAKGVPPKKDKQQAASLARRMAGKKGQTTQLQIEVNNEEEWEKLLLREGLIVIDVYSNWSGPCIGMIGNLKKAKVELGGDSLHLAIAKNDEIEALARFRNKSEPTWMFVAGGQLVTVTFGANAPKLLKLIEQELKQEIRVMRGETWRRSIPFNELCDEERERIEAAEKLKSEAQRIEAERIAREIEQKRMKVYNQMAEQLCYETVVIAFPHTIHPELGCLLYAELDQILRSQMMYVANQNKLLLTDEILQEVFFRGSIDFTDDLLEDFASGPSLAMLIKSQIIVAKGQEDEKHVGDIEKQICEAINLVRLVPGQELVIPDPFSLPAKYLYVKKIKEEIEEEDEEQPEITEEITAIPGCWTPASYITKCAAIRFLFPTRAEKVMSMDEFEIPPKVVIAFDISKQKECFELMEEYKNKIINFGYFSSTDPETAEHLCATPEQYTKLQHADTNKLIFVINKSKSEPLLSFAGLGAAYVSADENAGTLEADLFFPPGVEPTFHKLEEAELAERRGRADTTWLGDEDDLLAQEESIEQNEEDLMALLGVTIDENAKQGPDADNK